MKFCFPVASRYEGAGGQLAAGVTERARWIHPRGNFRRKGDFGCTMSPVQMPWQLKTLDDLLAQAEHYANYSMRNAARLPRGRR